MGEKIVDVPVIKQVEIPQIQTIEKVVEIPQVQTVEKVVEIPEVQTLAGATRSVNLPSASVRQTAPAEVVQVTEIGPPLPAETAPAIVTQAPMAAPAPAFTAAPAGLMQATMAAPISMAAPAMMEFSAAPAVTTIPTTTMFAPLVESFAAPMPTTYGVLP